MQIRSRLTEFVLMMLLIVSLSSGGIESRTLDEIGLTDNELRTIVSLTQLSASLMVYQEHFGTLGKEVPAEWMEIGELLNLIAPEISDSLTTHDDWGRPFLFLWADEGFLLVSVGEDGIGKCVEVVDNLIAGNLGVSSPREIRELVGDDLLYADGMLVAGPRSTVERTKITMADMRTIGTASEAFAIDWGHYPVLPRGVVQSPALRESISPVYVKRMPEVDGWGHPFVLKYEARGYLIISFGADGMPQHDYEGFELDSSGEIPNLYSEPADDIVYFNGSFISYPEGISRMYR